MWRVILSVALVAIAIPQSSLGAVAKQPAKKTAPKRQAAVAKPAASKPDPVKRLSEELVFNSISSNDANLADACGISNFKGLLWALDGVVGNWNYDKGEFETSADYADRMAKMESMINMSRKAIVCRSLRSETTFITYDADHQQFSVDSHALTSIDEDEKDMGSYISSTRMGVKAKVYRSLRVDYEVDLGDKYEVGRKLGCTTQMFDPLSFSVSSVRAQEIRAAGYAVMVGVLKQPFYSKRERSGEPTLDDPFDIYNVTLTLKFDPEQVFLVSPSGERFACTK